ncbi:C-C motif chemokine 20 [Dunckerocampus dactyliophorus]|uniref:C-C motif chemokine 20 n=1 Tax=Dunckerocampus dactyliophorus TaxID=161453 RepID=UPI0024054386|nr:C-C motif chemokine 20 [Dunckerocampus dactyliophorus]
MRSNTPFILLVLSCLCLAMAQVSYDDCCLSYVKKLDKKTQQRAVKYRIQETDGGCNIRAVIFTMRKGRVYCTDPRQTWVKELMDAIDKKPTPHPKKNTQKRQKNRLFS